MSMSIGLPDLTLIIKAAVSDAVKGVRQVKDEAERASSSFGMFRRAGAQAAGMLMRDMVRGASAAFSEMVRLGAAVGTLSNAFNRLVSISGISGMSLDDLKAATRGMISDVKLLTQANTAMMLGIKPDKFLELAKAALVLGPAVGKDAVYALESLTTGIGRQSRLMLDNVGITLDAADAYEWYAAQLGTTASALDETQRKMAWQSYATELATSKAAELGDILDEGIVKQAQWSAGWKNLTTSIGQFLAPLSAIQPILSPIMTMMGTMAGVLLPQMIGKLGGLIAAEWAHVVALKAKLAAWIVAHGTMTLGLILPVVAAAVAASTLLVSRALANIPSRQFGGVIPETGPYLLHKGETVIPSGRGGTTINIARMNVYPRDGDDFVRKMRRLGIS